MRMFGRNTLNSASIFLFLIGLVLFTDCKEQFDCLFGLFYSLGNVVQGLFSLESAQLIKEREIDRCSPVFSASYVTPFLWRIQKDFVVITP